MPTVLEMVEQHLKANGFDGLYHWCGECACQLDDLMPCDGDALQSCEAGYYHEGCPSDCGKGCSFHIMLEKPHESPEE